MFAHGLFPGDSGKDFAAVPAMLERDDVILLPHNAFNTSESVIRKCFQSVENLSLFLREGRFLTPVQI